MKERCLFCGALEYMEVSVGEWGGGTGERREFGGTKKSGESMARKHDSQSQLLVELIRDKELKIINECSLTVQLIHHSTIYQTTKLLLTV